MSKSEEGNSHNLHRGGGTDMCGFGFGIWTNCLYIYSNLEFYFYRKIFMLSETFQLNGININIYSQYIYFQHVYSQHMYFQHVC